MNLNKLQNLRIVEHRSTMREGLRVRGVATFNGQPVTFKTHTLIESRLDVYDWTKTPAFLFSISLSQEEFNQIQHEKDA
ncbi:hypothetical protein [Runella slithyformis]|uniref:Uncharacterized protein n=1 Tax=Runella slithyformis (strain ATCC 29530 / DSM 19594 / LMG 11500 / NCIMB 11436 / LSU 4) TaxID=761193 RepID=A0A7U4E737_RUNSL|nr:hypothetical protein [Runella slithyformis]AEI50253.1 hypothetical protein Runsl_3897 [Runella slithyformis DSM 19594]